jgi:hypothetical protein
LVVEHHSIAVAFTREKAGNIERPDRRFVGHMGLHIREISVCSRRIVRVEHGHEGSRIAIDKDSVLLVENGRAEQNPGLRLQGGEIKRTEISVAVGLQHLHVADTLAVAVEG